PACSTGSRSTSCMRSSPGSSSAGSPTRTSSSSSRTGSPPGTSPPRPPWSNGLARAERRAGCLDRLLAERVDHFRPREEPSLLVDREAVLQIRILEDRFDPAAVPVLAQQIRGDHLLALRSREEERERVPQEGAQPQHVTRLYSRPCAGLDRPRQVRGAGASR